MLEYQGNVMRNKENRNRIKRLPAYADFLLSLSGTCLVLFLASHLLFDATILFGPDTFNNVPKVLHAMYLAQIFTPIVTAGFFIHFIIAVRKIPFQTDKLIKFIRLSNQTKHRDTILWIFQCISGLLLLLAGTLHFWVIFADGIANINAISSSERAALMYFHVFYYIFMCIAIFHAGIGMYRVCIKWFGNGRKTVFLIMIIISCSYAVMSFMSIQKFYNRGEIQIILKQKIISIENIIQHKNESGMLESELRHFHSTMKKLQLRITPEMFDYLGITYNEDLYNILKKSESAD